MENIQNVNDIYSEKYGFSITPYDASETSGGLRKVRINIIDKTTGDAIEEVDVYTSAESVLFSTGNNLPDELVYLTSYTNTTKVPTDIGGIKEGSVFMAIQFKELFNRLIYPYVPPIFTFRSTLSKVYYEYGIDISPVSFTANVQKKSNNISEVNLWKNNLKYGSFKNFPTAGGNVSYNYTEKLNTTTTFYMKVDDDQDTYISESISVIFNHPIYYGTLSDSITIDQSIIETMDKYYEYDNINNISFTGSVSSNIECMVVAYKSYMGNTEKVKIFDQNGMDISASFTKQNIEIVDSTGSLVNYTCLKSNATKHNDFDITIKITN